MIDVNNYWNFFFFINWIFKYIGNVHITSDTSTWRQNNRILIREILWSALQYPRIKNEMKKIYITTLKKILQKWITLTNIWLRRIPLSHGWQNTLIFSLGYFIVIFLIPLLPLPLYTYRPLCWVRFIERVLCIHVFPPPCLQTVYNNKILYSHRSFVFNRNNSLCY